MPGDLFALAFMNYLFNDENLKRNFKMYKMKNLTVAISFCVVLRVGFKFAGKICAILHGCGLVKYTW